MAAGGAGAGFKFCDGGRAVWKSRLGRSKGKAGGRKGKAGGALGGSTDEWAEPEPAAKVRSVV